MSNVKSKAKKTAKKAARTFPNRKPSSKQRCQRVKAARAKKKCPPPVPGNGWRENIAGPQKSCASAWTEITEETRNIYRMNVDSPGEEDFMARNRRITRAYAELFLGHRSFRFLGAAIFGSKQVGCGLDVAKRYFGKFTGKVLSAPIVHPILHSAPGIAELTFILLSKGNVEVFKDVYPLHLFYHRYGRRRLKECTPPNFKARQVPQTFRRAFRELDAGCVRRANVRLLRYEQQRVLQKEVFNNRNFRAILIGNELTAPVRGLADVLAIKGLKSVLSSDCDEGPAVDYKGVDPAPFKHRWPFAKRVIGKFNELLSDRSDGGGQEYLLAEIRRILK